MAVWFIENELREGDWYLEVRVKHDGMRAQYRSTHLPTDTLQTKMFEGETCEIDAHRAFDERAIGLVHG